MQLIFFDCDTNDFRLSRKDGTVREAVLSVFELNIVGSFEPSS